ncbi:MAG: TetR family transcriptional regulator [Planctomycetes bacterium]|nr:TetR family transcriptional regulator [Planctomycetota bacterium]
MTTALAGRREKKRDALVSAAHALFRAQGFEATTIEQVAAAAGVSRRTFFRYFATKDAVVFPHAEARIAGFRAALRPRAGEAVEAAVRRAVLEVAREFAAHRDELLLQHALIASSPHLLAREHELDLAWEDAIVGALEARGEPGLRARVLGGAVAGALRAALRVWLAGKGKADLAALGQEALDLLAETCGAWGTTRRDAR